MLPNFFIVGAPKAGTTSLYYYLKEHPEVYMSPEKEPNFFSHQEIQSQNLYYKKRNTETLEDYQKLFNGVTYEKAIGEASVSYLFYHSVSKKIYSRVPHAKVIIILRNPVDRAFSHYLMDLRLGYISISFDDVIYKRGRYKNLNLYYQQYVELGLYHEQVKRYLTTFGKKNVLVLISNEFKKNTKKIVNSVYDFLRVDRTFFPVEEKKYNWFIMPKNRLSRYFYHIDGLRKLLKIVLSASSLKKIENLSFRSEKPTLKVETKEFLRSIYVEDIKRLENLIKKNLNFWLI